MKTVWFQLGDDGGAGAKACWEMGVGCVEKGLGSQRWEAPGCGWDQAQVEFIYLLRTLFGLIVPGRCTVKHSQAMLRLMLGNRDVPQDHS